MYVCSECGESFNQPGTCPADGKPTTPRGDDLVLGQTIGVYRVARLLGVGGMGRVYKGVHPSIGSRVAIKVLSRECSEKQELVDRFFSEARAVNLIRHESIVNVLDLSVLPDGRPYIIMEFLDGAALAELLAAQGRLPLGGLARLMGEVLDALQAAHAKAIVHRDLKPDNIFVTPQGRVKVLDFGIAKLMPEMGAAGPTRTGSLLGTPHYMAPEQALAHNVDARTDIYAAGVILYEASTGQKPFAAESLFDLLRKHIEAQPTPPRVLRPDMPPEYEQVILQAMAKNPAERFQSATALAQALAGAAQSLPPEAWAVVSPATAHSMPAMMGPPSMRTPSAPGTHPQWAAQGTAPGGPMTAPGGHPAQPTPPPGAPSWGHGSTVSSGQVMHHGQAPPRTGGKSKAPWIIGGVLAAGAITAGVVLATRGGDDDKQGVAAGGGELGDIGELGDLADLADGEGNIILPRNPDGTGDQIVIPEMPGVEPGEIPTPEDFAEQMAMDPKTLEDLAKYQKEAMKMAAEAMKNSGLEIGPDGQYIYKDPRAFEIPGYDPKRVDVTAVTAAALAKARTHYSDAELVRIDANGVFPDGHVDLTLSQTLYMQYTFNSPSRSGRPANVPKGMDYDAKCRYIVRFDGQSGAVGYPLDNWECEEPALGLPRCTAAQVWQKAIKKGADGKNAVANVGYWADDDGKGRWYLTIEGDDFSEFIPDDC